MVYFETEFGLVDWNENERIAMISWKQFASGENLKQPIEKLLELMISQKLEGWVGDLRGVKPITPEDQDWYDKTWLPKAINSGIKRAAVILPESVISTMSSKRFLSKMEDKEFELSYFQSVEEAKEWMKQ